MNEVSVTVNGFVGTKPTLHRSPNDVEWTTFRVASTRRVRDPQSGTWSDGKTLWFTVKTFRTSARNVAESVAQGDPVIVTGRLSAEEWVDKEGKDRWQLVIDAHAVGPDATRGLARFTRVVERADADPASSAAGEGGAPTDATDPWSGDGVPEHVPAPEQDLEPVGV